MLRKIAFLTEILESKKNTVFSKNFFSDNTVFIDYIPSLVEFLTLDKIYDRV
jgi:hypothetical protein